MSKLFDFKNLLKAYYRCRRNKRRTKSAASFELNFEKNLLRLEQELKDRSYRPGEYTCFAITDPKPREIWAAVFRDRVVHHLLVSFLEPVFEPKFIFHSYACRKGKGAHLAVRYLRKYISLLAFKGTPPLFYLQADIQSFYTSIDKNILYSLINKHIVHPDLLWLTQIVIIHDPTSNCLIKDSGNILPSIPPHKSLRFAPRDKGLPIGNLTSQFFANVYLNELDQYAKHTLKIRHYFRYMDDIVILGERKPDLIEWRNLIRYFLEQKLRLRLHPVKQIIRPVAYGVDFLGYITRPSYSLSRRRVVVGLKRKLYFFNRELNNRTSYLPDRNPNLSLPLIFPDEQPPGEFLEKVLASVNSSYGHFRHANCFRLRKKIYQNYFKELQKYFVPVDINYSYFKFRNLEKRFGRAH